jgi:hypothetical protein
MKRACLVIGALGFFLLASAARADWTTAKRLTWNDGASYSPKIVLNSWGHLHLVWYDNTLGHNEIYYKKSTDGGDTWTAAKRITWSSGDSQFAALAVDPSDRLHVVWVEDTSGGSEIYYKRSSDGGVTWTAKQRLTWAGITSSWPDIAVDSWGVIHLVWQDSTGEIYYSKSPDGTNWMLEKRLTWNSGTSQYPDIAIDSSNRLHVVWQDNTPGEYNYEIYYRKSTDAGLTWATAKRLTWMDNGSYRPDLAVDPSENLHLVWYDENPSLYKIYYKKSTDSGDSWTGAKRLTSDDGWTAYPCLAVDASGTLHLVWENMDGDLSYRKSANSGSTWTAIQRLTWTAGSSWDPIMVADPSGNLYLVWSDNTPLNREIYYKKFVN